MLRKVENCIKDRVRENNKEDLKQREYIILTNNCLAGFLYHDYRLQFNSPTINLQIMPIDFIKFCNKLEYYLEQEVIESKEKPKEYYDLSVKCDFPVGMIGDIPIFFQHYSDFAQAKAAWERRKKRMLELLHRGNEPYVILVLKSLDENVADKFKQLNYKNKIILSAEKSESDLVFKLSNWSKRDWWEYRKWYSLKRNYEEFDFTNWLNYHEVKNDE